MRFISLLTIGACIAGTPCWLAAQLPAPAGGAKAPQATGDMPGLIKSFSGQWSLKVTFAPSREIPQGLESTGTEAWHAGPEGLTLTDEEVFTAGPQTVIVVGLLWRDAKANEFHAMDCSNQNARTCDLKGAVDGVVVHWTGRTLTIDEKEVSEGTTMTSRVEWSDITPTTFTETGYLAPPGGPFEKVMTIHATRTAAQ